MTAAITATAAAIGIRPRRDITCRAYAAFVALVALVVLVAGAATVVFIVAIHDGDPPENGGLLFVSGVVAVRAGIAYMLRRLPLQQLLLFAPLSAAVLGCCSMRHGPRPGSRAGSSRREVFGLWLGLASAVLLLGVAFAFTRLYRRVLHTAT